MALQLSVGVRNARLDAIESTIGPDAVLKIFTGSKPANCAADDSGTLLVEMTLPSDWLADAASGSKGKAGTWQTNGSGNGNAGHFRIYEDNGISCHIQGTVSLSGGGGDLIIDNLSIATGQQVTISAFVLNDNNA